MLASLDFRSAMKMSYHVADEDKAKKTERRGQFEAMLTREELWGRYGRICVGDEVRSVYGGEFVIFGCSFGLHYRLPQGGGMVL
jgi:hypothetical protein